MQRTVGTSDEGTPAAAAIVGSYDLSQGAERQDNSLAAFDAEPVVVSKVETTWRRMFRRETGQDWLLAGGIS